MPMQNTPSANLKLSALCREGQLNKALHILLTTHNPTSNSNIYLQLLQICIAKNALSQGIQIHSLVTEREFAFASRTPFQNKLINMYFKCGNLLHARKVFDDMKERDGFSWNAIIAAYRRHGFPREALALFHQMQQTGFQPARFTFATILPACANLRALEQGMDIHGSIIERDFLSDVVLANALVDMYAKCGSIRKARELFDKIPEKDMFSWNAMVAGYAQIGDLGEALRLFKEMPHPDVVSWNAMVAGYAQNGLYENALEVFNQMQLEGVKLDSATFASMLPACAKMGTLEQCMGIHQIIVESGFSSNVVVASALVDTYAKSGNITKARQVFDKISKRNVVSWNAMIKGYAQNGFVEMALESFKQMQLSCVQPVSTTFASILTACAKIGVLEEGMKLHQNIIKSGTLSYVVVASALVDMYAKSGSTHKAYELFRKMPQRDVVSWTALIAGYVQNGFVEMALETYKQLRLASIKPDSTIFVSILPACAKLGALEQGMVFHQSIIESGLLSDAVANALIDMYAKCGRIHKACQLFNKLPRRDVISCNAMVAGYAQNGYCEDALKLFEAMKHSGLSLNHGSFTSVLFACSHAGLVDESCKYFNGMRNSYCILPDIDHYVCMVDLLSRAGYLEETLNFIIKMPVKPVVVVWTSLLGVCKSVKNLGLGEFTATLIFELYPENVGIYVLLSNIYAEVGRWSEAQMVRRLMRDRGIKKNPGCSWIKGNGGVHTFCVGDRSHLQTKEIYAKLDQLSWDTAGYFPGSRHIPNDLGEEDRESSS